MNTDGSQSGIKKTADLDTKFVSSMVSGYSILRTLIALLERKHNQSMEEKEKQGFARWKNSQKFAGYIHFLRTEDSKRDLRHQVSAHLQTSSNSKGRQTSSIRRNGAEDCAFAPNKFAMVYPETELEELNMGNPDPHRLSFEKTGCYGCLK